MEVLCQVLSSDNHQNTVIIGFKMYNIVTNGL